MNKKLETNILMHRNKTFRKSSLNIEKVLDMTLRIETESINILQKLDRMVNNSVLKDKLKFFMNEEENHKKILRKLLHEFRTENGNASPDDVRIPNLMMAFQEGISITDLLRIVLDAEKMAKEFYHYLASEIEDRRVCEICQYLSLVEQGHYDLLEGEYKLCLRYRMYPEHDRFQYFHLDFGP